MIWSWPTKYFTIIYISGCNSIVQVLQKARTKKIINKTASSNRENPQKMKLEPFGTLIRIGNRAAQIQTTIRLICLLINFPLSSIFAPIWSFWALCPFPISKYTHTYIHTLKPGCPIQAHSSYIAEFLRPCATGYTIDLLNTVYPTSGHVPAISHLHVAAKKLDCKRCQLLTASFSLARFLGGGGSHQLTSSPDCRVHLWNDKQFA